VALRLAAQRAAGEISARYFQPRPGIEQAAGEGMTVDGPADLLVQAGELAAHLSDPGWVVVDCRFNLQEPAAGRRLYAEGHIPGAWFADLDQDLAGPRQPHLGRHPLPDVAALERLFAGFGIGPDTRVVAYDDSGGALAARLWWLLRYLGHTRVSLLDGGLTAWRHAGLPESTAVPAPRSGAFRARPGCMPVLSTADVERELAGGRLALLDVRARERYLGRTEPIDPVAGHVPGALSAPFSANLGPDGRFRSPAELRRHYQALLADHPQTAVACMCGSGVTACHGVLALELAGLPGAGLYAGSWSEWIRSPDRPVAREADPLPP